MKTWTKSSKNRIDSVLSYSGLRKRAFSFLCSTEYGGKLEFHKGLANVQRCFVIDMVQGCRSIAEVS